MRTIIIFISAIILVGARRLCDVRIWYLNIIGDDVFNVELDREQLSLKYRIEQLVLTAAESKDKRMMDCTVLSMFNDMLKEQFSYVYSGTGMEMKEVESEATADSSKDSLNVHGFSFGSGKLEETDIDGIPNKMEQVYNKNNEKTQHRRDTSDKSGKKTENNSEEKYMLDNDIENTYAFSKNDEDSETYENMKQHDDLDGVDEIDGTKSVEYHDETELSDDTELNSIENESNTASIDNSINNVIITNKKGPINVRFGMCWSYRCSPFEIFDKECLLVEASTGVYHPTLSNDHNQTGYSRETKLHKRRRKMFSMTRYYCQSKSSCTAICLYILVLSKNICIDNYEDKHMHEIGENNIEGESNSDLFHSEDGHVRRMSTKPTEEIDSYEDTTVSDKNRDLYEELRNGSLAVDVSMEDEDKHPYIPLAEGVKMKEVHSPGDARTSKIMSEFEYVIEQKTMQYFSKMQALEMMIMKLENKILTEALNKQNHSSTITKLENHILKLENELLKINKKYENLKEETDNMRNKQNKYLELAYKQQAKKEYLELPDHSAKNFELISQHQAKLNELTSVIRNQTNIILSLKEKQTILEEQNIMLHQMVMNQSIFMTSIIKTVQDLSEQNIRSHKEIDSLRKKMDEMTLNQQSQLNRVYKNSNEDDEADVIEQLDTLLFNNKQQKHNMPKVLLQENQPPGRNPSLYLKQTSPFKKSSLLPWCPKENVTCPSCYYNTVLKSICVPYSSIIWSNCESHLKQDYIPRKNKDLPHIPDTQPESVSNAHYKGIFENQFDENLSIDQEMFSEEIAHSKEQNDQKKVVDMSEEDLSYHGNVYQQSETFNKADFQTDDGSKSMLIDNDEYYKYKIIGYDKFGKPVLKLREEYKETIETENSKRLAIELEQDNEEVTLNSKFTKEFKSFESFDGGNQEQEDTKTPIPSKTQSEKSVPNETADQDTRELAKDKKDFSNGVSFDNSENKMVIQTNEKPRSITNKNDQNAELATENEQAKTLDIRKKENNIPKTNDPKEAEINKGLKNKSDEKFEDRPEMEVKEKSKENIVPIYLRSTQQTEPKDCYDLYTRGDRKDGLFKVKPAGSDRMIDVFCDMRRGGWTVIQRRQDGTTNFFQTWEEYKKGFGGLYGEHWLGNDNIHLLTNQDYYKMRVDLMDWDKKKRYAEFEQFLVENEDEGYRLHIGGYSGDAGDGLTKHDGSKFSTKDVDNDKVVKEFGGSCANRFYGAGWYYKCYASNLNGRFYKGGTIPEKRFDGITWKPWTGPNHSLKKVEMKIRPASAK